MRNLYRTGTRSGPRRRGGARSHETAVSPRPRAPTRRRRTPPPPLARPTFAPPLLVAHARPPTSRKRRRRRRGRRAALSACGCSGPRPREVPRARAAGGGERPTASSAAGGERGRAGGGGPRRAARRTGRSSRRAAGLLGARAPKWASRRARRQRAPVDQRRWMDASTGSALPSPRPPPPPTVTRRAAGRYTRDGAGCPSRPPRPISCSRLSRASWAGPSAPPTARRSC